MAGTPTREELLGRIRAACAAWEGAVAAVPRGRLEEPGAAGADWSVKDVQAHLTADHRWLAGQLRAGLRGGLPTAAVCYGHDETPPPGADLADTEQRNRWRQAIDRRRPLDEVLANAPRWADELEAAVAALPEAELARPYTFADHAHIGHLRPATKGERGWPLHAIIASYADEHYAHHTADLRAAGQAADRQGGGPPVPPRLAPLLAQFDFALDRLVTRLDGLTDEEYHWEPVPGCWGVRPRGEQRTARAFGGGAWVLESARPAPDPPPFTTLAWRLCHLAGTVALRADYTVGSRAMTFDAYEMPGDAAAALAALRVAGAA